MSAQPGGKRKTAVSVAIAAAVLPAVFLFSQRNPAQPANAGDAAAGPGTRIVKVSAGPAVRTLRVSGSTVARNFASITAPMMRGPDSGRSLILIWLPKSGSIVKKGDLIARLDAKAIQDHADDIASQVQQLDADISKKKAEQAIQTETLRQNLRIAKANLDKAKLDAGAQAIRTPIDQEILNLAVEEAQATLKEQQTDLAMTEQSQKSELKVLQYGRDKQARHHGRHQHDVELFTVHAPIGGLVVMQSIWRGGDMGQVQQGDQVSPGQPFLKIVDTAGMQLEATINQAESEGVRIGQPAEIRFDAFPGLQLTGKVYSVGAMGVMGWRQNYYIRNIPVRVAITEHDPRVIPDLSASADVVLQRAENTVLLPLEALHRENGKSFVLVRQAGEFHEQTVQVGLKNNVDIAVTGLNAGDEVLIGTPATSRN